MSLVRPSLLQVAVRPVERVGIRAFSDAFWNGGRRGFAVDSKNSNKSSKASRQETENGKAGKSSKRAIFTATCENIAQADSSQKDLLYDFEESEVEALFPEKPCGDFEEDMNIIGRFSLMIRDGFLKINDQIVEIEQDESKRTADKKAIVFTGERGIGKSMALNTIVAKARSKDWITMFAPDCRLWVTPKGAIERGTGTGLPIVASELREGMFGQPKGSQIMLNIIKSMHGDKLKKLPKRLEYDHNAYNEGSTLMSIVDRGLKSKIFASDALYDLRLELSKVTEYPVLIAIDQMNSLYYPTCFYNKGEAVSPRNILFCKTFRSLDLDGKVLPEHKLERGLIVGSTSAKPGFPIPPETIMEHFQDTKDHFFVPFDVRGADLVDRSKDNVDLVKIQPFSASELRNYVYHLKRYKVTDTADILQNQGELETLKIYTGSVPREIRSTLIFPYPI